MPGAEHFDAASGEYTLSYRARAGQIEVWVPSSMYTAAPSIAVAGGKAHYDAEKQVLRITAMPGLRWR